MNDSSTSVSAGATVPTGNYTDKYNSKNPLQKLLVDNFIKVADGVLSKASPSSLIDVGCGEGILTRRWARQGQVTGRLVGIDLEDPELQAHWLDDVPDNLEFKTASADALPFADGEFEMATALEVLEHVPRPEAALAEMARVATKWVMLSVPREPVWRLLNMARGAYLKQFGNTPGHLNHWSKRSFIKLAQGFGEVELVRSPFPWTMALIYVG